MLTLTRRLPASGEAEVSLTLALTAEERTRSRHHFQHPDGSSVYLNLPRGTVLRDGDLLQSENGDRLIRIVAKSEPVLTVTAKTPLDLLRAAYHLGNRHVPVEVTTTYLRLSPDSVLEHLLHHLGVDIKSEILPFHPESGAYDHSHTQSHIHVH